MARSREKNWASPSSTAPGVFGIRPTGARGYGLLATNPFGWREFYNDPQKDGGWTIQQPKTLKFRYRVFIHHGDYRLAKVAEAYQEYEAHER